MSQHVQTEKIHFYLKLSKAILLDKTLMKRSQPHNSLNLLLTGPSYLNLLIPTSKDFILLLSTGTDHLTGNSGVFSLEKSDRRELHSCLVPSVDISTGGLSLGPNKELPYDNIMN